MQTWYANHHVTGIKNAISASFLLCKFRDAHVGLAAWPPCCKFRTRLFIAVSMAEGVSYAKATNDDEVLLQMAEPNMDPRKEEDAKGLYFTSDGSKKVDYVLVYEVCKEKEEKDPDYKDDARRMAELREKYQRSLRHQGLEMEEDEMLSPQVRFTLFPAG